MTIDSHPTHFVDAPALDAEIAAAKADTSLVGPEKAARLESLYKARYGTREVDPREVAASPPPAAPAVRANPVVTARERADETERRYRERWGTREVDAREVMVSAPTTTAPVASAAAPPSLTPASEVLLNLPTIPASSGYAYDSAAVAELGSVVASLGLPRDEVEMWGKIGFGRLVGKEVASRDVDAERAKFSEATIAQARSVLARLSPPARAAVHEWLAATDLGNSAAFIEWLAKQER